MNETDLAPLRVAIDARTALDRHLTGIGRYAVELLTALMKLGLGPVLYWNPLEGDCHAPETVCAGAQR